MAFPTTNEGLAEAGYKFRNAGRCRTCAADIEWWETPKGKRIPLDADTKQAHFATCPQADQHRRKN